MNAELEYDANFNEESAPLIDNQATSTTNYLALSSSSVLGDVPGINASLQLSNQALDGQCDYLDAADNKQYMIEMNRRLAREYPRMFTCIMGFLTMLFATAIIYFERLQADRFQFNDLTVLSYRTLNGLVLFASIVVIVYSLLAFISIVYRRYFFIQLLCILNLIGCFMSFVYLIAFNIVVLVFSILSSGECNYECIIMRSFSVLFGALITLLELVYFLLIQFNFLRNLNASPAHHVSTSAPAVPDTSSVSPSSNANC